MDTIENLSSLSEEQKKAIYALCDSTTFLWKTLINLEDSITSIKCKIRDKTYNKINKDLSILSDAGFFSYHLNIEASSIDGSVLELQLDDLSSGFHQLLKLFDTENSNLLDDSKKKTDISDIPVQPKPIYPKYNNLSHITRIPLAISEILPASRHFLIVFSKNPNNQISPFALLSLDSGTENLLAQPGNFWKTSFILSQTAEEHLFERHLGPSVGLKTIDEARWRFNQELTQAVNISQILDDAGLFVPCTLEKFENNEKSILDTFLVVDSDRLQQLDDVTFQRLRRGGILPLLYAHLVSLENFQELSRLELLNKIDVQSEKPYQQSAYSTQPSNDFPQRIQENFLGFLGFFKERFFLLYDFLQLFSRPSKPIAFGFIAFGLGWMYWPATPSNIIQYHPPPQDHGAKPKKTVQSLPKQKATIPKHFPRMVLVNISQMNMRNKPYFNHPVQKKLKQGTPLYVIQAENSWLLVSDPSNDIGWVIGYLTLDPTTKKRVNIY